MKKLFTVWIALVTGLAVWIALVTGLAVLSNGGCYTGQGPRMSCNPADYGCVPRLLPEAKPKRASYERH